MDVEEPKELIPEEDEVIFEESLEESLSDSDEEELEDIDLSDQDDPQFCTEYVNDIIDYLREREIKDRVSPNYMEKQPDINAKHRTILVDWMSDVCVKFSLLSETLFLASNVLDKYLASKAVARQKLQLVGVTAMLIASKYEEIYTPEINDFVWITAQAFTAEEIIKMERNILVTLDFHLNYALPLHFLRRWSKAAHSDSKVHTLCKYLIELSILDYDLLQFLPSMIAASAVFIARKMCGILPPWTHTLEHYSGFTATDVLPCARLLNQLLLKQATSKFQATRVKYSSEKFLGVALIPPVQF